MEEIVILNCGAGEDFGSSLDCKETKPVYSGFSSDRINLSPFTKGNQP